jgi:outer membrane protein TolC
MHRERAARAAYVQADEQYRSTVLTAFQNVADTLNALQQDADGLKAAAAAKDAAVVTLDLAKKQFQGGYLNYLGLLSAEQAYQQAVINLAQAEGNHYADTAALFQALGGGWWNRSDVPQPNPGYQVRDLANLACAAANTHSWRASRKCAGSAPKSRLAFTHGATAIAGSA